MKVMLLEHPRRIAQERCNDIANTPLSSSLITGSVAGMLLNCGHEINIVEGYLDKISYEEIFQEVSSFSPDLLGVHMVYSWENNQDLFTFLKKVKKENAVSTVVVYGFYPTFAYEEILYQCSAIDAVVIGEPEQTMADIAGFESKTLNPEKIPGLAWRDSSGGLGRSRREPLKNLDLLPYPLRSPAMMRMAEVNLEGSRGCYGGCTFCYINPYYGQNSCWRGHSPQYIFEEIDQIISRWGKKNFYFTDPNFFGPGQRGQERALTLAKILKQRNICFGIEARVNDIHEETVAALVDAGLRNILVGLESGRDDSLWRLNKMTTVAQNEQALEILRKYGIEPNVGFIMFEPDSSMEDIRTNYEFLERNDLLKNLAITANVLYHPQIILQGTRAYQKLQEQGRLVLKSTTYEGSAFFSDPQVELLAGAIGKVTNHLFIKMDRIWSGRDPEPQDAPQKYDALNSILVKFFTNTLESLELGRSFNPKEADCLVSDAKDRIDSLLPE